MEHLPINLLEYEALAQRKLSLPVWSYYFGGAADEISPRDNRAARSHPPCFWVDPDCGGSRWMTLPV